MEYLINLQKKRLCTKDFKIFLLNEIKKTKELIYKYCDDYMLLGILYHDYDILVKNIFENDREINR